MSRVAPRGGTAVLVACAVMLLARTWLMPPDEVSIEEVVHGFDAKALAENGRFANPNGLEALGSCDPVFLSLVGGPNGLVPQ